LAVSFAHSCFAASHFFWVQLRTLSDRGVFEESVADLAEDDFAAEGDAGVCATAEPDKATARNPAKTAVIRPLPARAIGILSPKSLSCDDAALRASTTVQNLRERDW
jgi:hypothetical protein